MPLFSHALTMALTACSTMIVAILPAKRRQGQYTARLVDRTARLTSGLVEDQDEATGDMSAAHGESRRETAHWSLERKL